MASIIRGDDDFDSSIGAEVSTFAAYLPSDQNIANATFTKVVISSEEFDTKAEYNASNARFTPTVAGYYQINAQVRMSLTGSSAEYFVALYKNGSQITRGTNHTFANSVNNAASVLSQVISLNGSGDYLEIYAYQTSGQTRTLAGGRNYCVFQGFLVRGA